MLRNDVDVVGSMILGLEGARNEKEIESRTRAMLARSLNVGNVVAFVGAGVSKAYDYPDWSEFTQSVARYTLKNLRGEISADSRVLLESFVKGGKAKSRRGSGQLRHDLARLHRNPLILGLCCEIAESTGPDNARRFRGRLSELAATRKHRRPIHPARDPLRILLEDLRIRRFLTTNYDEEIERAFCRVMGCEPDGLGLKEDPPARVASSADGAASAGEELHDAVRPLARSLPLGPMQPEELVQFSVGAPGFERGVFHLHGSIRDVDSMVVTERDYRRVYIQGGPLQRSFREALNLVFASNAVLFLGVGMSESDLLSPLRQFVAERENDGRERPLFALMPREGNAASRGEFRRFLYDRFGVKALYYPFQPDDRRNDLGDRTGFLCDALRDLAQGWTRWWKDWQQKPAVREPRFHRSRLNPAVMLHHPVIPSSQNFPDGRDMKRIGDELQGHRAVLLVGRAGTGKGSIAQRLVEMGVPGKHYRKRFFATMRFNNDFLSIVEAAAGHFGGVAQEESAAPIPRLREVLKQSCHLLVIGGVERLLSPAPLETQLAPENEDAMRWSLPLGLPMTGDVGDFFELVNDIARSGPSSVVLTSSMVPIGIDRILVKHVVLEGVEIGSVHAKVAGSLSRSAEAGRGIEELHDALRGHAYAIHVTAMTLKRITSKSGARHWLERLVARLGAVDLSRRPELTVSAALQQFLSGESPVNRERCLGVLQRVALFTTPVDGGTVLAGIPEGARSERAVNGLLNKLVAARLLIPIGEPASNEKRRYTAHSVVRGIVLEMLGCGSADVGEVHRLDLSTYATRCPEIHFGHESGHALTTRSVDALLYRLEHDGKLTGQARRRQLRGAFGILRSRFTATSVGRLAHMREESWGGCQRTHYDSYQGRLIRVLNGVRRASRGRLWSAYREERKGIQSRDGILYADELAWLYNEMALVAYCQGDVHDSYALFRLGQDVNVFSERRSHGQRWVHSELCLGMVQLERARFARARFHLQNAVVRGMRLRDTDLAASARGYLGLLEHLSGNFDRARDLYRTAIDSLQSLGNSRGVALFSMHAGDLKRKMGLFDEGRSAIRGAMAAAQEGRHIDLVQTIRVAEAVMLLKDESNVSPIQRRCEQAAKLLAGTIEFAHRVGIPKLEAGASLVLGQVHLIEGNLDEARRLAIRCLGLSCARGLRLRQTAGLVLLGRVANSRGDWAAAKGIFECAMRMAERQNYQLQIELAQRELLAVRRRIQ